MDKDIKQQQPVGVKPVAYVDPREVVVWLTLESQEGKDLYSAETVARLQAEKAQLQAERDDLAEAMDRAIKWNANPRVGIILKAALAKIEGSKSHEHR